MSLVWELDLPQNLKFVLLGFADHANDNGLCWPSIGRIAWKSGYSERQIQYIVRELRDKYGLLEAVRNAGGGRGLSAVYRVRPERGKKLSPFVAEKGAETAPFYEKGCSSAQQRVKPAAQKGAIAIAPQPSLTIKEPSTGRASAGAAASPARTPHHLHGEIRTWCAREWKLRFKKKPPWDGRDSKALKDLLQARPDLTLAEVQPVWKNYMTSTKKFYDDNGWPLWAFCKDFAGLSLHPVHDRGRQGTTPTAKPNGQGASTGKFAAYSRRTA